MRSSVMSLALFLVMSLFMISTRAIPAGTPTTSSDGATVTFFYDSAALTVQQREYVEVGTEWAQQQKEAWGDFPPFKIATSRDHFADTTHGVYTVKSKICPSNEDCDSDHSVGAMIVSVSEVRASFKLSIWRDSKGKKHDVHEVTIGRKDSKMTFEMKQNKPVVVEKKVAT
ncbi:hypothetical protein C8R42DRAFT_467672 [Lentinula raphanica]|nr:hypothetical protein C8R42DRAFT_467672 [Lentinula raphanica]